MELNFVRELGKGASGTVYLVERDGEPFALKVFGKVDLSPRARNMMLQEKRALQALAGIEGVPRVYDNISFQREGQKWYGLLLEYIPGLSLRAQTKLLMASDEVPTEQLIIKLTYRLARIFVDMAERGYIHRDIKPENIMLREPFYDPMIVDFGGACELRTCRNIVGTPAFFDRSIDIKDPPPYMTEDEYLAADVYSLGRTLQYVWQGGLYMKQYQVVDPTPLTEELLSPLLQFDPEQRPSMVDVKTLASRLLDDRSIVNMSLYSEGDIVSADKR